MRAIILFLLYAGLLLSGLMLPEDANAGELPRFVSLKSEEANMRVGPGTRYPVKWVYRRRHLPVEVVDEYGHWRKVRTMDGEEGWMHKSLLSGQRHVVIYQQTRTLRRKPDHATPPVVHAERHVVGELLNCTPGWCLLEIKQHRGWLPKPHLWGVYDDEIF